MPLVPRPHHLWRLRTRTLALGLETHIMAILNLTPDSFSEAAGHLASTAEATARALDLLDTGAHILDLGAESTRPNATPISPAEEQDRLLPVLEAVLRERPSAILSVDTYHASTAELAIRAGAEIINDVSGLLWDLSMAHTLAHLPPPTAHPSAPVSEPSPIPPSRGISTEAQRRGETSVLRSPTHHAPHLSTPSHVAAAAPPAASSTPGLVLMHTRGNPRQWTALPPLDPAASPTLIRYELACRLRAAEDAGISAEHIVLDPGFGFGKIGPENFPLLAHLETFHRLGRPLLVGISRKGFLAESVARALNLPAPPPAAARLHATTAANTAAILAGAHILRVHDPRPALEAAAIADSILAGL